MMRKLVIGVIAAASAAAGLVSAAAGAPAVVAGAGGRSGCPAVPSFPGGGFDRLAAGRGLWAVAGGRLVSTDRARSMPAVGAGSGDAVRHVATEPGVGTAYVVDRPGGDEVVVVTPDGTRTVSERTEATHPAWSPAGDLAWATGSGVAVLDHATGTVDRIRGPRGSGTVFSPVFLTTRRLAVVATAPATDRVPEGERLANLWTTRIGRHGWRRVSAFGAGVDRWVSIRTPIRSDDGGLLFVQVTGRASATHEPRFELWRFAKGEVTLVRPLPGERYLADVTAGRIVWNVPDYAHGRSLLVVEAADGPHSIGCGSVMVDPLEAVDPDRRAGTGQHVPARGDWPDLEAPAATSAEEIAVIVGDYATDSEVDPVVSSIRAAYPGSTVEVVDSTSAPLAIGPGVYGALLHLPPDADPTAALATFRGRLPEYSANSWIVTP